MTRMFPSRWVWIPLLVGVAQWVFPSLLPRASHWWLTPLGLWALLDPLLRLAVPERLPSTGPPHWSRRLMFWLGRELRRQWPVLLVLLAISLAPRIGYHQFGHWRDMYRTDWFLLAPLGLIHLILNLVVVFFLRSYPLPALSTVFALGCLGLVARMAVETASIREPAMWRGCEILWLLTKVTLLGCFGTLLEWRAGRKLQPLGVRGLLGEMAELPWYFHRAAQSPITRILRPRLRSWWIPLLFLLGYPILYFADALMGLFTIFGRTSSLSGYCWEWIVITSLLALLVLARETTSHLARLRQNGFLSAILLTEIRAGEIVAALANTCLRPFRWILVGIVAALLLMDLAVEPASIKFLVHFSYTLTCLVAVGIVGHALFGPFVNLAMRSRHWIEAALKIILQFAFLEVGILLLVWFLLSQDATYQGSGGDIWILRSLQVILPHVLLMMWIYRHWQMLLTDFEELAHGGFQPAKRIASRADVSAFRQQLGKSRQEPQEP